MSLKPQGAVLLTLIIALAAVIGILVVPRYTSDIVSSLVMLFGLYGFMFLSLAALINAFLREFVQAIGKPFIKIHHAFAFLGIAFITLHPVFNAIQSLSALVFVPIFDSWNGFWVFAGRPAFFILYIAFFAAVLRAKAKKHWKIIHELVYVVLFFGIVHANLLGNDFQNPAISAIFDTLFAVALSTFAIKRIRTYRLLKKMKKASTQKNAAEPSVNRLNS